MFSFGQKKELIHWEVVNFEERLQGFKYLMFHHSLTADSKVVDARSIFKYHMVDKGWDYVGYNFLIERVQGKIHLYYGRWLDMRGAHCAGSNMNSLAVSCCIVGNYDLRPPDEELWKYIIQFSREVLKKFEWKKGAIIGHRDFESQKTCPGLRFDLNRLRDAI